ncbi:MAG: 4-hydroxy-3-methylbut-2-enyl diphosphate reductase, partial [Oscillospiraceae bacterium]|nr:4-hydroxy-3-methylbut-2-enyl diphosphate reductase [Oscillospiraceae bacterium]
MKIEVASSAGFCFGVNRAVDAVYRLLEEGKKAATLGPIIHNPQIVSDLKERGVCVVERPEDTPPGAVLVIRSHGVPKSVTDRVAGLGLSCVDATCPFVKKLHDLARCAGEEGRTFLLFGDSGHPEVQGIIGHCVGEHYVIKDALELQNLLENNSLLANKPLTVAAQTTFNAQEWENTLKTLKKVCTNAVVFATICNATAKRQKEAKALAERSDAMLVIGGRNSSNTAKLRDICAQYCPTYLVEGADELPAFEAGTRIGIT